MPKYEYFNMKNNFLRQKLKLFFSTKILTFITYPRVYYKIK